jgi:NAD(P)H-dependent FMN reductase
MGNPAAWVAEVTPGATEDDVARAIAAARAESLPHVPTLAALPPRVDATGIAPRVGLPRRALLLVGSAKPAGTSASERLGRALLDRLAAKGWGVDVAHLARLVRLHRRDAPEFVARISDVDLVILATPVYVDSLPALVLAALERIGRGRHGHLLPIVQCGFPEISHTRLALEVLSEAADRLGFQWAGHLAAGGAGALAGQDLSAPSGPTWRVVRALDAAAEALHAGDPVPQEATLEFAAAPVPPWMYRLMGEAGWMFAALKEGVFWLGDEPFARHEPSSPDRPTLVER